MFRHNMTSFQVTSVSIYMMSTENLTSGMAAGSLGKIRQITRKFVQALHYQAQLLMQIHPLLSACDPR